ncbi:uncharacterized protein TNCV_871521 [Trichonephila clavipes]|nr:uncharacterized protein TNCV_871521 [Trichonephila clavipes]
MGFWKPLHEWQHKWFQDVMVPWINTKGDSVLYAMSPHTITPAVGVVCRCKTKAGLRRSPRSLHTRTRLSPLLRLNLDSSLKTTWSHSAAVQFPWAWHHSKRSYLWLRVEGSTRNGRRYPKCPSARRHRQTQWPLVNVLPVPG